MSNAPLGEIFFDVKFNFDTSSKAAMLQGMKKATNNLAKALEKITSDATSKGIDEGAKEAAQKLGRYGFGGGGGAIFGKSWGFGILTPWNPNVIGAYISARYMHQIINTILTTIDDVVKKYANRESNAIKETSTDPMTKTLENISQIKNVLPSISTKSAFFIDEASRGTNVKSTEIASELKKMIDHGVASNPNEALAKYIDILGYNQTGRSKRLHAFGGASSTADEFRYANVIANLNNLLTSEEYTKYVDILDELSQASEESKKKDIFSRGEYIRNHFLSRYSAAQIKKERDKEAKEKEKNSKIAKNLNAKGLSQEEELKLFAEQSKTWSDKERREIFGQLIKNHEYSKLMILHNQGMEELRSSGLTERQAKSPANILLESINNTLLKILEWQAKNPTFTPPVD